MVKTQTRLNKKKHFDLKSLTHWFKLEKIKAIKTSPQKEN